MGFNYGYEKKKFDSRWKRLEVEYCDAGMSEEQIAAMKEYDWAWFCSQRVFQNHTQPIPCEQYDEVCGQSQLFRKFASLSYQWDVDKIDQTRYGWLASVENEQLLLRLKKLSKKDLELLTLLFVDGYRQIDVARLWHCSRSAVAQRFKKIKNFLNTVNGFAFPNRIVGEIAQKEQIWRYSHEKNRFFFLYIYTVFTCTCISVPCHVFCYGSHSVLRTYPLYFLFQPYLRRSLEQNIRFMVHDTYKYPYHDCIFPALYRSIWLLVSCRV